ncbi:MAG: molybdopterin-guanine dinucleotide biosynthesis protein B [Methanocalculus sp.]|uniref:molybdopterin-guanine dinucleotide biosynthesis protein B n=1 Tax=Methanocalculus sp. TaxID=2004547 RepID=UPI0027195388|nr:molybdopterin-guanine dinucleotide biosynthesis protein B [Methanocalculus sp.]MDO9540261.1 molybdopterin-guanine dinucleotide biosynthesis protein B [Methanocalculus sp.]
MIVIHIFGRSNSGKTTLIRTLCNRLATSGRVETIKHLGHHSFILEEGKDTTVHFTSGASGSTGIDEEKCVTVVSDGDLFSALDAASDRGADFCIVEGYKNVLLPGAALGDVKGEHILMRDPTTEDIVSRLDEFPRWTTPKAILDALLRKGDGGVVGGIIHLHSVSKQSLERAASTALTCQNITAAQGSLSLSGCDIHSVRKRGFLAVTGRSAASVAYALLQGAEELEKDAHQEDFNRRKSEE